MSLVIYNTLNTKKEEFKPLNKDRVTMYVCGVTPYGPAHLGHARCYVTFDTIRRYLEYKGYKVQYIQNITDIDDKIIKQSQEQNIPWQKISERYTQDYFEVMGRLNIQGIDCYPRATEYIEKMQEVIQVLINRGFAYTVGGNVYFSVRKFDKYGELSHRSLEGMRSGIRIEVEEAKRDPLDFALWKRAKEGEPFWDSPWGPGRPGWHIECSTMSLDCLGETLDIHGGGADLIFPHHENEIAQSESYTGKEFVRYWIHNGFVTLKREKMAKSLGNVFNLQDIFRKYKDLFEIHNESQISQIVRLFLLSQHYRSPIDFSEDKLAQARKNWERICFTLEDIELDDYDNAIARGHITKSLKQDKTIDKIISEFEQVMNDDFNTAQGLAVVYKFISLINERIGFKEHLPWLKLARLKIKELLDNILGLKYIPSGFQRQLDTTEIIVDEINEEGARKNKNWQKTDFQKEQKMRVRIVDSFVEEREEARRNKDWERADVLRKKLDQMGFIIEDTPRGTRLRRKR